MELDSVEDRPVRHGSDFLDRRKPSAAVIGVIFTMIVQLCVIVWFAATLKAQVSNLQETTRDMRAEQRTMTLLIQNLQLDVATSKAKAGSND